MKNKILAVFMALALLLTACSDLITPAKQEGIHITVSVPPQKWLVERIASDLVSVQSMVKPGDDAHTYEPTPQQMVELAQTDIYFTIGVEFEHAWMPRLSNANRSMRVVDLAEGIQLQAMPEGHTHAEEAHEGEYTYNTEPDEHANEMDTHVWLSPANMRLLADNLAKTLASYNPQNREVYAQNLETLLAEIDTLDQQIQSLLATRTRDAFMVIHPAWGYFAHAYGLQQLPVESGGQEPTPESLGELIHTAEEYQVNTIFVQRGTDTKFARSLAEQIGVNQIVELDPLAETWDANLLDVAGKLAEALR